MLKVYRNQETKSGGGGEFLVEVLLRSCMDVVMIESFLFTIKTLFQGILSSQISGPLVSKVLLYLSSVP